MIIKELIIDPYSLYPITYFLKQKSLIFSNDNSKGKTSLIRLILYSLGLKIPSTTKINWGQITTKCVIESRGKILACIRDNNNFVIINDDQSEIKYNLDYEDQENKALSFIFGFENILLCKNFLAAMYIDQEKGWTLFNKGKVIGNISFNIEEFINGISDKTNEILKINSELDNLTKEINKYNIISQAITVNDDLETSCENPVVIKKNDLLAKRISLNAAKSSYEENLSMLKQMQQNNADIKNIIDNCNLLVSFKGEEFNLTTKNIVNFHINQNILESQISNNKIALDKVNKEINDVNYKLKNICPIIDAKEASDIFYSNLNKLQINQMQILSILEELKKHRKELKERKKFLALENVSITNFMKQKFIEISSSLEVYDFIKNEKDILFVNNLKQYSGRILHLLSLTYKLVYNLTIQQFLGIKLPFIVDTPDSGGLTSDNSKKIIETIMNLLPTNQIIISTSLQVNNSDFDEVIELNNGCLNTL